MKFSELVFDHDGCCDQQGGWATVRHDNGARSDVYKDGEGFAVATFAGNVLLKGKETLTSDAEVEARLLADSKIDC